MAEKAKKAGKSKLNAQIDAMFARVGQLTKKQRLIICVAVFALFGGGFYYFVYMPKSQELSRLKQAHEQAENKLSLFKAKAKALAKWEKEMESVQADFNIALEALPDKKEIPAMLTGISQAGSKAGLKFLLFQTETEINQGFYKELPLSVKVEGRYHQIADFFFQVAHMGRIINIKQMDMQYKKEKEKGADPGNIEMSCTAVTYMFVDSQENGQTQKANRKKGHKRG